MRDSKRYHSQSGIKLFTLLIVIALCANNAARAQSGGTASKTADISAFAGYTYSHPDYASFHDNGGTIGLDYTRYFRWRIIPSFELRANHNTGPILDHEAVMAGLRFQIDLHRFHPYVDGFFGATKIVFVHPRSPTYTHDNAPVTSAGGGIDIDMVHHFQARIDFQEEFMNFGPNGTKINNADFTLTPTLFTVGVVYHIPFHGRPGDGPR